MALKDRVSSNRSKRFGNVAPSPDSKSNQKIYSSSDSELEDSLEQIKVREGCFSIKRLRKDGENFKIDGDHIYTSGKSGDLMDVYKPRQSQRKRRTTSEESDEKPMKMRCSSKNAVMARLNRERKKRYVSTLETENEDLRKDNDEINKKIKMQNKAISTMKREISYLKGLLANSKELSQILQNLKATTGLPVTSSFILSEDLKKETNKVVVEELHSLSIRSDNGDYNFPILDKDVNLGSSSDKSYSCSDIADLEIPSLELESDIYENFEQSFNINSIFDNNSLNINLGFEESSKLDDFPDDFLSDVGICLHVNKKKISVEVCSICNSKASLSGPPTEELTPDIVNAT